MVALKNGSAGICRAEIGAEERAVVAEKFLDTRATVTYDPGIDDIRRARLREPCDRPCLAGRDIGNPYYSGRGTLYHRRRDHRVRYEIFYHERCRDAQRRIVQISSSSFHDAIIHDWTGHEEHTLNGRKA